MPEEGVLPKGHDDILSYEQILRFVKACVLLGIKKVRITGGEPLVRKGIVEFAARLKKTPGIDEVNLTTNAVLLPQYAKDLKEAGINSINIGLNTLKACRYRQITRRGDINDVLYGIDSALEEGFDRVKINVVMMKGFNDDEVLDFINLTKTRPLIVRFIELMPIAQACNYPEMYLSSQEVKGKIHGLDEVGLNFGNGPAKYYNIPGYEGFVGFISSLSESFCGDCNRIRLTADGKLMTCLHSGQEFDIKGRINEADTVALANEIAQILKGKPEGHSFAASTGQVGRSDCDRFMSQVGG
jgi:cyclic pyranopterin phosphate synthase